MTEPIVLPPGVAIAVLAFLLSLLPAALFIWLWYLRRKDRYVSAGAVGVAFGGGAALVAAAYYLEQQAPYLWNRFFPDTAYYFSGAVLSVQTWSDVLWPAVGTFLIVSLIEEGVRYIFLSFWFRFSRVVDQMFDGLVVGLAAGLGFATLENTLYFFDLFRAGHFDTLVFVFFLRFLISTLAHVSFGGVMGVLLARSIFSVYRPRWRYVQAFLVPWFMHGLYDWLLGINQTVYAVMALLLPLYVLISWGSRREFFVKYRRQKGIPVEEQTEILAAPGVAAYESRWNTTAMWLKPRPAKRLKENGRYV